MPNPARIDATANRVRAISTGPVPVSRLLDVGLTRAQVRSAVSAGGLIVLRRGIVLPGEDWESGSLDVRRRWALQAALIAYPRAFASHDTAAWLRGLPDYRRESRSDGPVPATTITRLGAGRRDDWLRIHGCDTPRSFVTDLGDVPVTDLARTSIELSATRSLRTAVVYLDAGMRLWVAEAAGRVPIREAVHDPRLRAAARLHWHAALGPYARHRWVRLVRVAVEIADPAAETVLESVSRASIAESDIPVPRLGVPVVGDDGRRYWVDMAWDEYRVIGEADGAVKYVDRDALVQEKRRQEAIEAQGWRFVRWGMPDVVPDPEPMLNRIRRALFP